MGMRIMMIGKFCHNNQLYLKGELNIIGSYALHFYFVEICITPPQIWFNKAD
jgi:hypothetical protein